MNEQLSLQVDSAGASYLYETAKWARFIAIIGFIMTGLLVMFGLFAGSILSLAGSGTTGKVPAVLISVLYILFALLYFFPLLYLYRFGTRMKEALLNNNQEVLDDSFKNIKSCFRFVGILTIVILAIYALCILLVIIFGAAAFMQH
ncbi:MAG: hypothetical protein JWN76_3156 [Chitinophagaceae bacterium]|nr:hypothetical protein [Chitinophagaceae bacterium]